VTTAFYDLPSSKAGSGYKIPTVQEDCDRYDLRTKYYVKRYGIDEEFQLESAWNVQGFWVGGLCEPDVVSGTVVNIIDHQGEPEGADKHRFAIWGALRAAQVPQRVQAYTFELPPN
jgi:hypothetical protein